MGIFKQVIEAILSTAGKAVSVQNPLPSDGDSIYSKDIDTTRSDNYNFTGDVTDYFDSLSSINIDSTGNNPKQIKLWFHRTVYSHAIGFGCDDISKGFGNSITVKLLGSAEEVRATFNYSPTNPRSFLAEFGTAAFNGVILEFNTVSEVCLSNITIQKSIYSNSNIRGVSPLGNVQGVNVTELGNLTVSVNEYGDTPSIDAFARLRISEPFTLFDSKQLHDKQPLFWDEELAGSATSVHNSVDADVEMTVTANASDFIIRQTKQRFNYQPGKSQLIFMTFQGSQVVGVTKRVGVFDGTGVNNLIPNNGIFFETNGQVSWNIAKNGVTTETVTQSNWNVDKLDGTGPSGITLDLDSCLIAIIDYEWLGVGRVRVGFVIQGIIIYVHYFNHANDITFTDVYMSTPNLPLRYDIQSDGSAGGVLDHICSTIISEGGQQKTGVLRVADTGSTHVDANTADVNYAIVGIRLKTNYKDVTVIPESISAINENNDDFRWSLCLNPTIAGTFTYSDLNFSAVQTARGQTANTVSDENIVLASGYASVDTLSASESLTTSLNIGMTIAGVQDELVFCVTPLSNGADIQASLNFRELL